MKRFRRGFTLIEMLIALGILSTVTLAAAAALRTGVDAWRRTELTTRMTQEARRVLEELGRELRASATVPGKPWELEADRLAFDTVRIDGEDPGYFRMTYFIGKKDGPLEKIREGYRKDDEKAKAAFHTESDAEILFLYPDYNPENPETTLWKAEWNSEGIIPPVIRVRLTLFESDGTPHNYLRTLWVPVGGKA